jgi:hypothetical protein
VGAIHTLRRFSVTVNNLTEGTDILLIEYKKQVDLKCDYCTSKLSDFIDRQEQQPVTLLDAYKLARLFNWSVKGVVAKCPVCA